MAKRSNRSRVRFVPNKLILDGRIRDSHVLTIQLGRDDQTYIGKLRKPDIEVKFWLSNLEIKGQAHEELYCSVLCDGLSGEVIEPVPSDRFRDAEHVRQWVESIIQYLNFHLPHRLRTTLLLTMEEAIAKASQVHDLADCDERKLAAAHALIVEKQIKKALKVRPGPEGLFKSAYQYKKALLDAAKKLQARKEAITQEACAEEISTTYANALLNHDVDQRQIRKWNDEFDINWKKFTAIQKRKNYA